MGTRFLEDCRTARLASVSWVLKCIREQLVGCGAEEAEEPKETVLQGAWPLLFSLGEAQRRKPGLVGVLGNI